MEWETSQKIKRGISTAGACIAFAVMGRTASADIVYFDESFAQRIEVTQHHDFFPCSNQRFQALRDCGGFFAGDENGVGTRADS